MLNNLYLLVPLLITLNLLNAGLIVMLILNITCLAKNYSWCLSEPVGFILSIFGIILFFVTTALTMKPCHNCYIICRNKNAKYSTLLEEN